MLIYLNDLSQTKLDVGFYVSRMKSNVYKQTVLIHGKALASSCKRNFQVGRKAKGNSCEDNRHSPIFTHAQTDITSTTPVM